MTPEFLIHVGPHKTGSTYLQRSLVRLRDRLLQRGVFYPRHWMKEPDASHQLLAARLKAGDYRALRSEIEDLRTSDCVQIVLSAEDLADVPAEAAGQFRSMLGGATANIVFYCRRWTELLPSAWQENVKQGSDVTLPEFLLAHLEHPFGSNVVNFGSCLEKFERAFGQSNLHLVSYSHIVDSGMDLFRHFCEVFLDWHDPPTEPANPNSSLGLFEIELIRCLNAIERRRTGKHTAEMSLRFLERRTKLDLASVIKAMEQDIGTFRLDSDREGLRRVHDSIIGRFGRLVVPPAPDDRLFTASVADIRYVRQNYLSTRGIPCLIKRIHEQLLYPSDSRALRIGWRNLARASPVRSIRLWT